MPVRHRETVVVGNHQPKPEPTKKPEPPVLAPVPEPTHDEHFDLTDTSDEKTPVQSGKSKSKRRK